MVILRQDMLGYPCSRRQLLAALGQEYHLAANLPLNLRLAAQRVDDAELAAWLRGRAEEEEACCCEVTDDLTDLGAELPPAPLPATLRLMERVRELAYSDRPQRLLGLLQARDEAAAPWYLAEPVPRDDWRWRRCQAHWEQRRGGSLRQPAAAALGRLDAVRLRDVMDHAAALAGLYQQFLEAPLAAAIQSAAA